MTPRSILAVLHARPEHQRVAIVAAFGILASWITYQIVYLVMPFEPRATLSWFFAFALGLVRQHHLHRTISFPGSGVTYATSLRRDAMVGAALVGISTGLNWLLTVRLGIDHQLAWAVCVVTAAALTYAPMKFYVFRRLRRPAKEGEGNVAS